MAIYYVDTNGSDTADGSAGSPWQTINHAVNQPLQPGDEIVVRSGTYTEQVYVTQGGALDNHVTIRSEEPGGAMIRPPEGSYSTVLVQADYVNFEGFDVQGGGGHGIEVHHVHHVNVVDNVAHDSGGSGISAAYGEFIVIEGNTTFNNATTNGWHTSGISVFQARNISGDTTTDGYRIIVRDNISYNNTEGPSITSEHTDGNGIIIDDFQSTQNGSFSPYQFTTLVENNLVYHNGGKGIQVVWSDLVTVRNNTAYHNNQDTLNPGTWRGEISNSQSSDNIYVNNIAVSDPSVHSDNTAISHTSYDGYINTNVIWANNLTYSGVAGDFSVKTDGGNEMPPLTSGNLLGVDPGFVNPPHDFRLTDGSVAIDSGTDAFGLSLVDIDGQLRMVGVVDIGAFEFNSTPVFQPPACEDYPVPLPQPKMTGEAACDDYLQVPGSQDGPKDPATQDDARLELFGDPGFTGPEIFFDWAMTEDLPPEKPTVEGLVSKDRFDFVAAVPPGAVMVTGHDLPVPEGRDTGQIHVEPVPSVIDQIVVAGGAHLDEGLFW